MVGVEGADTGPRRPDEFFGKLTVNQPRVQKFVPNIFEANESDYIKTTQRIYFSAQYPTYIELPVMKN